MLGPTGIEGDYDSIEFSGKKRIFGDFDDLVIGPPTGPNDISIESIEVRGLDTFKNESFGDRSGDRPDHFHSRRSLTCDNESSFPLAA